MFRLLLSWFPLHLASHIIVNWCYIHSLMIYKGIWLISLNSRISRQLYFPLVIKNQLHLHVQVSWSFHFPHPKRLSDKSFILKTKLFLPQRPRNGHNKVLGTRLLKHSEVLINSLTCYLHFLALLSQLT